ncbi:hypothetical protein A4X09_0g7831 [Tilletia walkeri]|uniref:Uncharacterized protein n=1 Tax=Tilletia walkeri TaxID=117179 RepID=A0A8X7T0Z3_9BASI|nr:hypothetical protein A4X09_0g7831 [Tilletia walkeri]
MSGFVYPRPHAGALRTCLGTDDNPYLFLALEDGAVQQQHDQQQELHSEVTGTVDNPHVVSDSEHTEEDEDDGLGLVNLSDVDVDEDMVDQAIRDATAVAVAAAADHIISAGQDGQPPAYTMPSFRERGDDFLGAISVMQGEPREHWSGYVLRFFRPEIEHEVDARTAHLHARINTLSNDTVTLRRLLSRLPDATRRFRFGARSAWALNKFRRTDFDNMAPAQVRSLARQLLAAADGDINHPIIRRNAVYSACIRRYQLL